MANPQVENGYTQIANELFDALVLVPLSDYEHRILGFILRKTYGFKKKQDWISQKQIAKELGIHKCNVSRTIKKLVKKNMIIKNNKVMGIQKNYEEWKLSKQITNKVIQIGNKYKIIKKKLSKQITEVINIDKKKLSKQHPTKDTIQKKLIQKEKYLDFVFLAEKEYKKLTDRVGKDKTDEWISKLNNHIGSIGDKYKSHYYTILKWIQKEPPLKEGKRYDRL